MILENNFFGIYEKALPKVSWAEKLEIAQQLGFDFIELSIDESEERIARLDWNEKEISEILALQKKYQIMIRSICFSAQRKFPLGSIDEKIRNKSLEMMEKCIILAHQIGAKIIQLAGYDVYYEPKSEKTKKYFLQGLEASLKIANRYGVMLAIETMDDPFIKSIADYQQITQKITSPWLAVYPDLGNLSAWLKEKVYEDVHQFIDQAVGVHLKDTLAVEKTKPGVFKKVPFGSGCVDFVGLLKILKEKEYSGSFLIEAWFEDPEYQDPIQELKNALIFIKDKLKKGGW